MKRYFPIAVLAFISAPGLLAFELSRPAETVLSESRNQPALAVAHKGILYFSQAVSLDADEDNDCPAQDLYSYDPKTKTESRLLRIPCVQRLESNEIELLIYHRIDERKQGATVFDGHKASRAFDSKILRLLEARLHFTRSALKMPRDVSFSHFPIVLKDTVTFISIASDSNGMIFFDRYERTTGKPLTASILMKPGHVGFSLERVLSVGILNSAQLYFVLKATGEQPATISVFNLQDGSWTIIGNSHALSTNWKTSPRARWSIDTPRFLTPFDKGFLIADRSPRPYAHAKSISLYTENDDFQRLRIPSEDMGGISYFRKGLLVSRPWAGKIEWFGERTFSESLTRMEEK